jgi:glycine/D-amino acid oxidase-like deaminating enzyme
LLATNALVPQYVPRLERALRAERGQVIVTEPLSERPCRGSFGTSLAWWREIEEPDGRFRLLFGGGRTRDEPDSLFPQFTPDGRPHPQLEMGGFRQSPDHQRRLETQLAILFPKLAGAKITHRWGGLQSFTADNLPEVGLFDEERQIYGMAGFCGRGNCHSDVGAEYLAGKVAGVVSEVERRFGTLFETLMCVGRESANWGPWQSSHERANTTQPKS